MALRPENGCWRRGIYDAAEGCVSRCKGFVSGVLEHEVHHETVYFSGRVQGVGFRYLASQVAREFEVTGIVANLADGRVHLEAEGRADQVKAFVAAIEERMQGYIRKVERNSSKRRPQFSGFAIR